MAHSRHFLAAMTVVCTCLAATPAFAQDLQGTILEPIQKLWSGGSDNAVTYDVTLTVKGENDDLKDVIESNSGLVAQSDNGVPAASTLLALAREEPAQITAALYTQGYYSGRIVIAVNDQIIDERITEITLPDEGLAPVIITVEPGPLFHFNTIDVSYSDGQDASGADFDTAGLVSGAPAKSGAVLEAGNRLVATWKSRGHAFARVASRNVVADHDKRTIDVALVVDRGKQVQFGDVEIKGAERFEAELLKTRAAIPENETYSPEALTGARKRLTKLAGIRGVRIIEADKPDAQGRIPVVVDVTERKPGFYGANAALSSVDGAEVGAYWGYRNILGGGESVRVDGKVSNLGGDSAEELEYEGKISFTKPSETSAYTDYKTTLAIRHEVPDSYESDEVSLSTGATHQFSEELSGELAIKASWIETEEDVFGASEFFLISLPAKLVYDTRDNPLDASKGIRASASAEPAVDFYEDTVAFVETFGQVSTYYQIGQTPNVIAATRFGVGTVVGAEIDEVPATSRFLGGGGGSVRGYAFRSIGPELEGEIVGGLSIAEMSAELRFKINEDFGVVPFVDAAFVTSDSFFAGTTETAVGAGIGLRYYTSIGPIRFDVATPLDRIDGEPEVVFYVGLGQSF